MSLFVVTAKESANADTGKTKISNNGNAIAIFLITGELAVVYNLLLPPITVGSHYIRNTWNGRSSHFRPQKLPECRGRGRNQA
jgi:hypothetical protein